MCADLQLNPNPKSLLVKGSFHITAHFFVGAGDAQSPGEVLGEDWEAGGARARLGEYVTVLAQPDACARHAPRGAERPAHCDG